MTLGFLLAKEFKQFIRTPVFIGLTLVFPAAIMLVIPWIVSMDIKNIGVVVVDYDRSGASSDFISAVGASGYFIMDGMVPDYDAALRKVELSESDAVIVIPDGFERDLLFEGGAPVQVSINAVNETRGTLGASYLGAICASFSADFFEKHGTMPKFSRPDMQVPNVEVSVQNRYNPMMDYKWFMIPGLFVIILVMLCGSLPAMNIVGEKEKGTIEQINITPVSKTVFILSKMIPYWIMGVGVLAISMVIAYVVYGLAPLGSVWVIAVFSLIFIFAVSSFGLVVSNYSNTTQQAMFVMFFFILVFLLMSGLLTPIESMPEWTQVITYVNPLRYYIEMMRSVYLMGGGFGDLMPQLWALITFAVVLGSWAVLSYKKQS